jgi:hypothetical protein
MQPAQLVSYLIGEIYGSACMYRYKPPASLGKYCQPIGRLLAPKAFLLHPPQLQRLEIVIVLPLESSNWHISDGDCASEEATLLLVIVPKNVLPKNQASD